MYPDNAAHQKPFVSTASNTKQQSPPSLSKSTSQLTTTYCQLVNKLTNLQRNSLLLSAKKPTNYPNFLLPHLRLLLTSQRLLAISNLRIACLRITQLSHVKKVSTRESFSNFGRSLLWALDHAENSLSLVDQLGDRDELQVMKTIGVIFHLVERFCNREWGIEQCRSEANDRIGEDSLNVMVPSKQDPVHIPSTRSRSAIKHPASGLASDELVQLDGSVMNQRSNESMLLSCGSHYIFGDGKLIMPAAYMRQNSEGCLVPFRVAVNDYENDLGRLTGARARSVEIVYPDKTCFQFIPVQSIRLLHCKCPNLSFVGGIAKHNMISQAMVTVEMSSHVYATILCICEEAYYQQFPEATQLFRPKSALKPPFEVIEMPMLTGCFTRVLDGQQVVEHPLTVAFDMRRNRLSGSGLFKVEFVQELDMTKIIFSLAGIVVENEFLIDNDNILELGNE